MYSFDVWHVALSCWKCPWLSSVHCRFGGTWGICPFGRGRQRRSVSHSLPLWERCLQYIYYCLGRCFRREQPVPVRPLRESPLLGLDRTGGALVGGVVHCCLRRPTLPMDSWTHQWIPPGWFRVPYRLGEWRREVACTARGRPLCNRVVDSDEQVKLLMHQRRLPGKSSAGQGSS